MQNVKEKAVNQIITKEKQIIEILQFQDEQRDELKSEVARLSSELQKCQKSDRMKVDVDNQHILKLEREIKELKAELQYYNDKYENLE